MHVYARKSEQPVYANVCQSSCFWYSDKVGRWSLGYSVRGESTPGKDFGDWGDRAYVCKGRLPMQLAEALSGRGEGSLEAGAKTKCTRKYNEEKNAPEEHVA